jgi:hypothetical protein
LSTDPAMTRRVGDGTLPSHRESRRSPTPHVAANAATERTPGTDILFCMSGATQRAANSKMTIEVSLRNQRVKPIKAAGESFT